MSSLLYLILFSFHLHFSLLLLGENLFPVCCGSEKDVSVLYFLVALFCMICDWLVFYYKVMLALVSCSMESVNYFVMFRKVIFGGGIYTILFVAGLLMFDFVSPLGGDQYFICRGCDDLSLEIPNNKTKVMLVPKVDEVQTVKIGNIGGGGSTFNAPFNNQAIGFVDGNITIYNGPVFKVTGLPGTSSGPIISVEKKVEGTFFKGISPTSGSSSTSDEAAIINTSVQDLDPCSSAILKVDILSNIIHKIQLPYSSQDAAQISAYLSRLDEMNKASDKLWMSMRDLSVHCGKVESMHPYANMHYSNINKSYNHLYVAMGSLPTDPATFPLSYLDSNAYITAALEHCSMMKDGLMGLCICLNK